jgi:hypothetical protein
MPSLSSLQLGRAFRLIMQTLPIAAVRLGANIAFWVVTLVYLGITGGLAYLVWQAIPAVGVILFLVALGGLGPLYKLAQKYVLYVIKAAQIAVMAEILVNDRLPAGASQLAWGKERVQERFGEVSAMFLVDELVSGVVSAFTGVVYRVASFLPGDTFRSLANILNRVIRFAVGYIDEAILARTFWLQSGSVWANARDGVVLYGMVWKPLLANAVALMFLSYVPFIVVAILFSAPIGALTSLISPNVAGWSIIATLVLAYLVKVAIGDAFAMAAMISAYQRETQELEPDPAVTSKLEQISDRFRTLQQRALGEQAGAALGGEAGTTPALDTGADASE